jgi:predicted Zn-dependent peptidase
MSLVKTIVSIDRLEEARKAITNTINTAIDTLTIDEVQAAQQAVINSLVDNFESNRSIAGTFLFLRKHNLPVNFFDTRAAQLRAISKDDIIAAVKPILSTDKMIEIQVGRV